MRCERCIGRKKLFKINNIFSLTNTGGMEITCPTCNGTGQVEKQNSAQEENANEEKTDKKTKKI